MDAPGPRLSALSSAEQLRYATEIVRIEAHALAALADRLDESFCRAVELLYSCRGSAIISGMGKAGLIGQKVAATLASTGTRSHFLHPAEAVHGDLGRVHRDDVAVLLSQSGETEELVRLLAPLTELHVPILAITGRAASTLGRASTAVLELGPLQEACALGLAPSTSTTAMLALGDALALVTSRMRSFGRDDFARFHPAGSLGRQLTRVESLMRPLAECRVVDQEKTVRQVFTERSLPARRSGAVLITHEGVLVGIFTDSDLARLFERRRDAALDQPIGDVMTRNCCQVPHGSFMRDALAIMAERKISELPVVDSRGAPVGMIDVTDVGAHWAKELAAPPEPPRVPPPLFASVFRGAAHPTHKPAAQKPTTPSW